MTGPGTSAEGGAGEPPPLLVTAPVGGVATGLAEVPDPVFAAAMVGPGAAVDPERAAGPVLAPVTGTLIKLKPHAFIVTDDAGRGVLVHLGIDTVTLDGDGFVLLAAEGDRVLAGMPIVHWDPAAVAASGRSPACPVIALDAAPESVQVLASGPVRAGQPLFRWI